MPLSDRQHDDRTSAAGMPTTRGPQASDLDSGDTGGEEALRQSGGPYTAHSNLCAGDRRVRLSVRDEEEDSTNADIHGID